MTRRRSGTNWSWLRWLIESNLREHAGFQKPFRLEEKIQSLGNGLFHENYLFKVSGKYLVLRIGIVKRGLRTQSEAVKHLRWEAKTLHALPSCNFPFVVPELVCLVNDESGETVGLIESTVDGMPLSFLLRGRDPEEPLKIIARVAAAVHALDKSEFRHLAQHADAQSHVMTNLKGLPDSLFEQFGEAANARDWILAQLPDDRASTVLHGDLLPQNLLLETRENRETAVAVVDWESAQIGDPAYDLAIVTRGVRKPLGVPFGLQRLVQFYNEAAEHKASPNAVVVHELWLHLHWLTEASEARAKNQFGGHGPEHYANLLGGILRRAQAGG
jgi:aminoglycoside phosphotransferase (APT) family kinase protein